MAVAEFQKSAMKTCRLRTSHHTRSNSRSRCSGVIIRSSVNERPIGM